MPRKPGIYRKVKRYDVTALVVNLKDGTTFTDVYQTPVLKDKLQVMKYLEKNYNNSRIKIVKIKKMVEKESQYFLSIDNYLKYAIELNKKGEK